MNHPRQGMVTDRYGNVRFRPNAIVRFLLENSRFNMNTIAGASFSTEDRVQFAQLIGYSVSRFGELSYVPRHIAEHTDRLARLMALLDTK